MEVVEPSSRSSHLVNAHQCFIFMIDVQSVFMQGLESNKRTVFLNKYLHLVKLAKALEIPIIITAEDIQKNGTI